MDNEDQAWSDDLEERSYAYDDAKTELRVLNALTGSEFLLYILFNADDQLNHVVSSDKFPAYDIVIRAKENGTQLTSKQRYAVTNVYLWSVFGWTQDQLREVQSDERY